MTIDLGRGSWSEVPDRPLVLVPIGSTEQHGAHLPLTTDTLIAEAVSDAVARRLPGPVRVAPAQAFGASGEHQDFAGTISIGTEALTTLAVELGRSLMTWAHRVVFVNGHGGNTVGLIRAVTQLILEGRDVAWVQCSAPGDAHAGHTETSIMLHLAPETVDLTRAEVGNTDPIKTLMPLLLTRGVSAVAPNGVLGDPTTASAGEGQRLFAAMVDTAVTRIRHGQTDEFGMLVPTEVGVP